MKPIQTAVDILSEAEASLRGLMERAIAEQQYREVATIATIADSIASLIVSSSRPGGITDSEGAASGWAGEPSPEEARSNDGQGSVDVPPRRPRDGRVGYPRFEREANKLIKIGWSKKDRRAYEHRAPREAVLLFSGVLAKKARNGRVFTMAELLPLRAEQGHDIPSYQAYLALAWLRSLGIVKRRGKQGYIVKNGFLDPAHLTQSWEQVPLRE